MHNDGSQSKHLYSNTLLAFTAQSLLTAAT